MPLEDANRLAEIDPATGRATLRAAGGLLGDEFGSTLSLGGRAPARGARDASRGVAASAAGSP